MGREPSRVNKSYKVRLDTKTPLPILGFFYYNKLLGCGGVFTVMFASTYGGDDMGRTFISCRGR